MTKFYIEADDATYTFFTTTANGTPVLAASYEKNGESRTIWTADWTQLPTDEQQATDLLRDIDWAVELESMLD